MSLCGDRYADRAVTTAYTTLYYWSHRGGNAAGINIHRRAGGSRRKWRMNAGVGWLLSGKDIVGMAVSTTDDTASDAQA
jgi:hypothetical protein